MGEDSDSNEEKSFRERVEEIRRQREEEQAKEERSTSSASEPSPSSGSSEENSFRERVEEIRRQRGEEQANSSTTESSSSARTGPPDSRRNTIGRTVWLKADDEVGDWEACKGRITAGLEAGIDWVLVDRSNVAKVRELGRVNVAAFAGHYILGMDAEEAEPDLLVVGKGGEGDGTIDLPSDLSGSADLTTLRRSDLAAKGSYVRITSPDHETFVEAAATEAAYTIVVGEDWKTIPLENLIARISEDTTLVVGVRSAEEARTTFERLEFGVDGVLLDTDDPDEIRETVRLREEADREMHDLEDATVPGHNHEKSLRKQPPVGEIPVGPDVTVDYDALTEREFIGGGGNADVRKATLPTPDGNISLAIKEPRLSGTLHAEQVERMLKEAETWDKLDDHDHIVGVVDWGSEPLPWIAMECMDGGHLDERADQMDVRQALWTAVAVTKGVRHAHRRGVAHLDLKPENVLFRSVEGAWDVPKVADWGLSKHLLEHSRSVEGVSPTYAAPEQFDDEYGVADEITDIYQLGVVFYELFTGRPPFEGRPTEVMRAVMDDQPTPPSEIADIPAELDEILLMALGKQKEDRYDALVYLRDDLQELYDEY